MAEHDSRDALLLALITEHTVLQTASNATVSDAGARSSLYLLSLSSSLVAMGFASQSGNAFLPFVAAVLPAVFVLGLFTIVRLVDSTIENMQYLQGIARIRAHYRTLSPEAAAQFAAKLGRWPEAYSAPSLQLGSFLAFLTTTASMIAFINGFVAGVGVTLLDYKLSAEPSLAIAISAGVAALVVFMALFFLFQRWRFSSIDSDGSASVVTNVR